MFFFPDFLRFGEKIDCLYQVLLNLPLLYWILLRYTKSCLFLDYRNLFLYINLKIPTKPGVRSYNTYILHIYMYKKHAHSVISKNHTALNFTVLLYFESFDFL